MSSVQTTSMGVVCFDISHPEGPRRELIGGIHNAEWCSIVWYRLDTSSIISTREGESWSLALEVIDNVISARYGVDNTLQRAGIVLRSPDIERGLLDSDAYRPDNIWQKLQDVRNCEFSSLFIFCLVSSF